MKYLIIILFPILLFAEQFSPLKNLIFALWPEYDHPGVLVIYSGDLRQSSLPVTLKLPVENGAHNAIIRGAIPGDSVRSARIIDENGVKFISEKIIQPEFTIEYYFNPYDEKSPERKFSMDFSFPFSPDTLSIFVQQPVFARDFKSNLPNPDTIEDMHRMKYQKIQLTDFKKGERFPVKFSYTNGNNDLSLQFFQRMLQNAQNKQQPSQQESDKIGTSQNNRWILRIVIVFVLIAGTVYYYRKKQIQGRNKSDVS